MQAVSGSKLVRIAAVLLFCHALAACDIAVDGHGGFDFGVGAQAKDEWTRTYQISPGGRFELINVNGRINAEASDGTAIEVKAERTAKATTEEAAKELLNRIEMREEVGADRVRVEVRAPRSGPSGHDFTWTVRIPRGVSVDLRTVNGGVNMTNLEGEIVARTTNGAIKGYGLAATSVDASTTNGGVEIELAKAVTSGTYELDAVNGGVAIMLPPDSKADISGRCVNGGISTTDLELQLNGEQSRRRLNATLNGGGARITLDTVNGGVRIGRAGSMTN